MPKEGPTKTADTERVAANLVKLARIESGLSQRALATAANVSQSTIARIEAGIMQPTLPLLYKILAGADLEPRIRLAQYDDHDDVLDALAARFPKRQKKMEKARDETLAALSPSLRRTGGRAG
jgi:transcriptional regulator with XRE-family HTH domain